MSTIWGYCKKLGMKSSWISPLENMQIPSGEIPEGISMGQRLHCDAVWRPPPSCAHSGLQLYLTHWLNCAFSKKANLPSPGFESVAVFCVCRGLEVLHGGPTWTVSLTCFVWLVSSSCRALQSHRTYITLDWAFLSARCSFPLLPHDLLGCWHEVFLCLFPAPEACPLRITFHRLALSALFSVSPWQGHKHWGTSIGAELGIYLG